MRLSHNQRVSIAFLVLATAFGGVVYFMYLDYQRFKPRQEAIDRMWERHMRLRLAEDRCIVETGDTRCEYSIQEMRLQSEQMRVERYEDAKRRLQEAGIK